MCVLPLAALTHVTFHDVTDLPVFCLDGVAYDRSRGPPVRVSTLADARHVRPAVANHLALFGEAVEAAGRIHHQVDRLAAESPALYVRHAAAMLSRIDAFEVWSFKRNVTLNPGNSIQTAVNNNPAGTTFRLNPGIYRQQSVQPLNGDVFIGSPGAILNGSSLLTSFAQTSSKTRTPGLVLVALPIWGLLINQSDFAHETLARMLPLRDMFGAFFFVTVGALIDPRRLLDNVPLLVTMVLLVVVGKMVIRVGVVRLFGETPWTALLTGVGLAQIGEFSFVLVQAARREGYIGQDIYQATLATSLITILLNATLVQLVSRHIGSFRAARGPRNTAPRSRTLEGHVILCGYGRVGSAVAEALETFGVPYVTIETDPPRFAVQILDPSYAIFSGCGGMSEAMVVTAPAGWLGSSM
jgi:hypothetical protein